MSYCLEEGKPLNQQILESLKPILSFSKHVTINMERLVDFASKLDEKALSEIEKGDFSRELIRKYMQNKRDAVDLLGMFNSINFCYWSQKKADKWKYFSNITGTEEDGAKALFLALIENYQKDNHFFFGSNLKALDQNRLKRTLVNRNTMPLFQERLDILKEFGKTIEAKYDDHFYNFVKVNSQFNASKIISNFLRDFPSFDDSYPYNGKRVLFLKRAQLLVSMVHSIFSDIFDHSVIEELTAFADYKIPMVLEHLGTLQYSGELKERIRRRELIPKGSQMELEIRASTIFAIEEIKKKCQIKINSAQIDKLLWYKSQKIKRNYHLTVTTAY